MEKKKLSSFNLLLAKIGVIILYLSIGLALLKVAITSFPDWLVLGPFFLGMSLIAFGILVELAQLYFRSQK